MRASSRSDRVALVMGGPIVKFISAIDLPVLLLGLFDSLISAGRVPEFDDSVDIRSACRV